MSGPPNAGLGFYSRHLTEDDVVHIGAATKNILARATGQVWLGLGSPHAWYSVQDSEASDGTIVLNGRKLNKAESILNGLLHSGSYDHIIQTILKYLNATQLACLQKVFVNMFCICYLLITILPRPAGPGLSSWSPMCGVMWGHWTS